MNSTITITPIDNIKNNSIVNNDLIKIKTHDSDMDVFIMEGKDGKRRTSNLMELSLYEDLIIIDNVKHKVLNMLSRN